MEQASHDGEMQFGIGMAIVALGMVVGDLTEVSKKTNTQIDKLNINIERYSVSSEKNATAMKWLTAGLFIVGLAQIVTAVILKN